MKVFVILSVLFASTAFAGKKVYDLKMNLFIDGRQVSSPHIVSREGEKAMLTQSGKNGGNFVEVVAMPVVLNGKESIQMNFTVGTISAKGVRKILATPRLITGNNQTAEISQDNANGQTLALVVRPSTIAQ